MAASPALPEMPTKGTRKRPAIHALGDDSVRQIDGEAAEGVIKEKRIGERIKQLRLKKSMGLVELGRRTGLSASFLSQLETGRVVPTLRNLARISMVFSKDLSYFFAPDPRPLFRIRRRAERVRLSQPGVEDPACFFESLGSLVPDRQLDPYFAEFLPARAEQSHQHLGCEFLFMLTGRLTLKHGGEAHVIEEGDAIYFDAATRHSYMCVGPERATALIVTLQQPALGTGSGSEVTAQRQKSPHSLPGGRPVLSAGGSADAGQTASQSA